MGLGIAALRSLRISAVQLRSLCSAARSYTKWRTMVAHLLSLALIWHWAHYSQSIPPIGEHPRHQLNFIRLDHSMTTAMPGTAGVWFRKCLRLHDNEALVKAGLLKIADQAIVYPRYLTTLTWLMRIYSWRCPILWSERLRKAARFRHSVQQCQRHFICYMWLKNDTCADNFDTDNFERFLVLLTGQKRPSKTALFAHTSSLAAATGRFQQRSMTWRKTGHDQSHHESSSVSMNFSSQCLAYFLLAGSHIRQGGSFLHPGPTLCRLRRCEQVQLFAAEFAGQKPCQQVAAQFFECSVRKWEIL